MALGPSPTRACRRAAVRQCMRHAVDSRRSATPARRAAVRARSPRGARGRGARGRFHCAASGGEGRKWRRGSRGTHEELAAAVAAMAVAAAAASDRRQRVGPECAGWLTPCAGGDLRSQHGPVRRGRGCDCAMRCYGLDGAKCTHVSLEARSGCGRSTRVTEKRLRHQRRRKNARLGSGCTSNCDVRRVV